MPKTKKNLAAIKKSYKKTLCCIGGSAGLFIILMVVLICLGAYHIIPDLGVIVGCIGSGIALTGILICLTIANDLYKRDKIFCASQANELKALTEGDWANARSLVADGNSREKEMAMQLLHELEAGTLGTAIQPSYIVVEHEMGYAHKHSMTVSYPLPVVSSLDEQVKEKAHILHDFLKKCEKMNQATADEFAVFRDNALSRYLEEERRIPIGVGNIISAYAFPFPSPITEEDTTAALENFTQRNPRKK